MNTHEKNPDISFIIIPLRVLLQLLKKYLTHILQLINLLSLNEAGKFS